MDAYSADYSTYGMPDTSNGSGPTGIPDPNNPGYDTAGFPLPGRTQPPAARVPPAANDPVNGAPNVTQPQPADTSGGGGGGLVDPYTGPAPTFQGAPAFTPPTFTKAAPFTLPTGQEVLNEDPSYGFRLGQGEQALQNSAAAGGVLNTGNTLKDILGYGQNFASQEYGNAVNRRKSVYDTNYQTQTIDPYKFAYEGALDTFAPKMANWSAANNFDWSKYLQDYMQFRNRQLDTVAANAQTS